MSGSNGLVPGRVVLAVLSAQTATYINELRAISRNTDADAQLLLAAAHQGNDVKEGDIVPAIVTAVWGPETINVKVMLDGCDAAWVTSIGFDGGQTDPATPENPAPVTVYRPHSWHWMFSGQETRYTPNVDQLTAIVETALAKLVPEQRMLEIAQAAATKVVADAVAAHESDPRSRASLKADLEQALASAKNNEAPYGVNAAYVGLVAALKIVLADYFTD